MFPTRIGVTTLFDNFPLFFLIAKVQHTFRFK